MIKLETYQTILKFYYIQVGLLVIIAGVLIIVSRSSAALFSRCVPACVHVNVSPTVKMWRWRRVTHSRNMDPMAHLWQRKRQKVVKNSIHYTQRIWLWLQRAKNPSLAKFSRRVQSVGFGTGHRHLLFPCARTWTSKLRWLVYYWIT